MAYAVTKYASSVPVHSTGSDSSPVVTTIPSFGGFEWNWIDSNYPGWVYVTYSGRSGYAKRSLIEKIKYPTGTNGASLTLTDWNTWDWFKPDFNNITFCSQYDIEIELTTPGKGNDTTSCFEMRQNFKYIGFDLVLGWGKHVSNPNAEHTGWFCNTEYSLVIPGYWNLPWRDLGELEAGTNYKFWMNFKTRYGNVLNNNKTPLVLGSDSGPYAGKTLTWDLVRQILGNATTIFVRPWVRVTANSVGGTEELKDAGFLYAGWVNNFTNPTDGHTMNNGGQVRMPRPQVYYLTHRLNDYVDNGRHHEFPVKIRCYYNPYYTVWKAPSSGTVAQNNAQMGLWNIMMTPNDVELDIYLYGKGEKKLYSETIHPDDVINSRNGWFRVGDWVGIGGSGKCGNIFAKDIEINSSPINPGRNGADGMEVWLRSESWHLQSGQRVGPMDNGFSIEGWEIRHRKTAIGGFTESEFMAAYTDCRNNNYVTPNVSFSVNIPPRKDNTIKPYSYVTATNNVTDKDNDHIDYSWKFRSSQAQDSGSNYWINDVYLADKTRSVTLSPIDLLRELDKKYGRPSDRRQLGIESMNEDSFSENGHTKKSDTAFSGAGWTGYRLEYPVGNVRVEISPKPTVVELRGQRVIPGRYIPKATIKYDTPRGYDGNKHRLEIITTAVPSSTDRLDTTLLLGGTWCEEVDWQGRLNNWVTSYEMNNIDVYARTGNNPSLRGNFVQFFASVITQGGWSYDKWHQEGNNVSDVFFLNMYPTCVNNMTNREYKDNDINCYLRVGFTITDRNFNLKTKRLDLVFNMPDGAYKCITIENINITSENSKETRPVGFYNITQILKNNGIDDILLIGTVMEIHIHAENLYDFSQTWDGTRVGSGPWSKTFLYDRSPEPILNISQRKGESCDVTITHNSRYPKRVFYTIKVKKAGESDASLKTLCQDVEHPNIHFVPTQHGYLDNLRGDLFEFKFSFRTDGDVNISMQNQLSSNRWFRWNEIPTLSITGQEARILPNVDNNNIIERIKPQYAMQYSLRVRAIDPDTKTLICKSNIARGEVPYMTENLPGGVADKEILITPKSLDDNSIRYNGNKHVYPVNFDSTGIDFISNFCTCHDSYNKYSGTVTSNKYILLDPIKRKNIVYSAGPNSEKIGDTVYGLSFKVDFDIESPLTSQFTSSTYRYRHYLLGKEVGSNDTFWVNCQGWDEGNKVPSHRTMIMTMDDYVRQHIHPGKTYEFILISTIQTTTDDATKLFYLKTLPFGKFIYGTYPIAPKLIYPTSVRQPCKNPPLIVQIPNQTDITNNTIDDIGIIKNGEWCGWNSESRWGTVQSNYNNKTIAFQWGGIEINETCRLKFRIKSKLTGLTSDSQEYIINCGVDNNLIVNRGDLIKPLIPLQNAVNAFRQAYGMSNYSYPNASRGILITYDILVQSVLNAYREAGEKIKSYGGKYNETSVPREVIIKANVSNQLYDIITKCPR